MVDGTITPCWSYEDHDELWSRKHGTTGFNAQLLCLLDGTAIYISNPLPGKTHDARAFIPEEAGPCQGERELGLWGDYGGSAGVRDWRSPVS